MISNISLPRLNPELPFPKTAVRPDRPQPESVPSEPAVSAQTGYPQAQACPSARTLCAFVDEQADENADDTPPLPTPVTISEAEAEASGPAAEASREPEFTGAAPLPTRVDLTPPSGPPCPSAAQIKAGAAIHPFESGPEVKIMKARMASLGYTLSEGDRFSPEDAKQIQKLRKTFGLTAAGPNSGKVDAETWKFLNTWADAKDTASAETLIGKARNIPKIKQSCLNRVCEAYKQTYGDYGNMPMVGLAKDSASHFKHDPRLREIKLTREMLTDPQALRLLNGAIVVYDAQAGDGFSPTAGHIEVWDTQAMKTHYGNPLFPGGDRLELTAQQLAHATVFVPVKP